MGFYVGSSDTAVPFDTLVTNYLSQHNGVFSSADMLSMHSQISLMKPLLLVFTLSYMLLPLVFAYIWLLFRPSGWTYKYLWTFVFVNFLGLLGGNAIPGKESDDVSIRQQHILEYGKDLRVFWARVWWYTLPINSIFLVYSII